MKKAALQFIQAVDGFAALRWLNRRRVLILTYHRFAETETQGKVSSAQFRQHLQYLKANYNVLPLGEIVQLLDNGKTLPRNAVALTIDDGYDDAYKIAFPLLKEYDLPATVFVITDFLDRKVWLWTDKARFLTSKTALEKIETDDFSFTFNGAESRNMAAAKLNENLKRLPDEDKEAKLESLQNIFEINLPALPPAEFAAMSWQQAREMDKNGVAIESHTVTHPILTNVRDERLEFELKTSRRRVSENLGRETDLFCYPNGGFDERAKQFVRKAGYRAAVTTEIGFNERETDLYALHRNDAQPDFMNFVQSASGFEIFKKQTRKLIG
ncbi:MAG TPA: polysaccharide deacetylase family protein [Pyrinomonadaceae bacterium]|nr:polysaccharide deacetylase family protein [Pyrinomonadaceae bacterium]